MPWTLDGLPAFRCVRCFSLYVIPHLEATYGPSKEVDKLLANPCAACGKGTIVPIGMLYYRPAESDK